MSASPKTEFQFPWYQGRLRGWQSDYILVIIAMDTVRLRASIAAGDNSGASNEFLPFTKLRPLMKAPYPGRGWDRRHQEKDTIVKLSDFKHVRLNPAGPRRSRIGVMCIFKKNSQDRRSRCTIRSIRQTRALTCVSLFIFTNSFSRIRATRPHDEPPENPGGFGASPFSPAKAISSSQVGGSSEAANRGELRGRAC